MTTPDELEATTRAAAARIVAELGVEPDPAVLTLVAIAWLDGRQNGLSWADKNFYEESTP